MAMHPAQQQPDYALLPGAPSSLPSPVSSQGGGRGQRQTSHDTNMDDLGSQSDENPLKSGRGLSLNFLKSKSSKTTKDGVPARKRGPKRDAKPAMSRRQELNRQAQRTHRERKEYYTKSLELEVSRMREQYVELVNLHKRTERRAVKAEETVKDPEVEMLKHENDRLKQLLQASGIAFNLVVPHGPTAPATNPQLPKSRNAGSRTMKQQHAPQSKPLVNEQITGLDPFSQPLSNGKVPKSYPQQAQSLNHGQPHPTHHHVDHSNCQHPSTNGYQQSSAYQQNSFSAEPMDTHPAYRQQLDHSISMASQDSRASSSVSPISPISPPRASSQNDYNAYQSSSFGGSSFGNAVATPTTMQSRQSPTYAESSISLQTSHPESDIIDSIISESSSAFRPPIGQGFVDGRVVRNTSDERIKQQQMDHDQLGIEFVLALEQTCKDHQLFLNQRANPPATQDMNFELSGHAMMLTNPPPSVLATNPAVDQHQPPSVPTSNLLALMESAQRLPLTGGEITPVLALRVIRADERYGLLTRQHFEMIKEKLKGSSRCYGFGAVLETYEVKDALDSVFEPFKNLNINSGQHVR